MLFLAGYEILSMFIYFMNEISIFRKGDSQITYEISTTLTIIFINTAIATGSGIFYQKEWSLICWIYFFQIFRSMMFYLSQRKSDPIISLNMRNVLFSRCKFNKPRQIRCCLLSFYIFYITIYFKSCSNKLFNAHSYYVNMPNQILPYLLKSAYSFVSF